MSETYKARFILTESTDETPCITDLLEWLEEGSLVSSTVHSISEDDASPRTIDVSIEGMFELRSFVEETTAAYISEEGSDVSLEFVEVSA